MDEKGSLQETQNEVEEVDDEDEEEELLLPKKEKPLTRQKWVEGEVAELRQYFKEHFKAGTTPRSQEIDKVKKMSKESKGLIHNRANHLIVKKISNMNHSQRRRSCCFQSRKSHQQGRSGWKGKWQSSDSTSKNILRLEQYLGHRK